MPETERFIQLNNWMLNSAAWQATTVYERSLYLALKQRYNGFNNGDIAFSHREAQAALNCSNVPVIKAFNGLIQKGFIRAAQVGSFHWKKGGGAGGRSTRWVLTEYSLDHPMKSHSPERSFMRWKLEPERNQRCDDITPMVWPGHTMKARVV
jgi:hypothetical protein